MIAELLLFGATGDLAGRFLFPALAELISRNRLPADFRILGAAPERWELGEFREHVRQRLSVHATALPRSAHDAVVNALSYRRIDVADAADVQTALADLEARKNPIATYLALPAGLFPAAIAALSSLKFPEGSRLVVEKPFGVDLQSAVSLNQLLHRAIGNASERAVFRVDHVLGMPTVRNLLSLRFANRVFQPLWNAEHIEQVDILWEETLGLEGRAGYYDRAGALKDVMQNHMLQLLALVAMEPPENLDEMALREAKVRLLKSVRTPTLEDVGNNTRRARYSAGTLQSESGPNRPVPAYAQEEGVDPRRNTETFAEVALLVDSPRWTGTRFVLRAGKALARRRKQVVLHLRSAAGADGPRNILRIGIDGPRDVSLQLMGLGAGPDHGVTEQIMSLPEPSGAGSAYAAVLLDILSGGSSLSVRGDEAEQAWRILMPVVEGWRQGAVPLEEYAAGSQGLAPRGPR